jgi:hypothetical protein
VRCSGPAKKIAVTISSNEVVNAKTAPDTTPGAINGKTTRKNAVAGRAPRLVLARHRLASNLIRNAFSEQAATWTRNGFHARGPTRR